MNDSVMQRVAYLSGLISLLSQADSMNLPALFLRSERLCKILFMNSQVDVKSNSREHL